MQSEAESHTSKNNSEMKNATITEKEMHWKKKKNNQQPSH